MRMGTQEHRSGMRAAQVVLVHGTRCAARYPFVGLVLLFFVFHRTVVKLVPRRADRQQ